MIYDSLLSRPNIAYAPQSSETEAPIAVVYVPPTLGAVDDSAAPRPRLSRPPRSSAIELLAPPLAAPPALGFCEDSPSVRGRLVRTRPTPDGEVLAALSQPPSAGPPLDVYPCRAAAEPAVRSTSTEGWLVAAAAVTSSATGLPWDSFMGAARFASAPLLVTEEPLLPLVQVAPAPPWLELASPARRQPFRRPRLPMVDDVALWGSLGAYVPPPCDVAVVESFVLGDVVARSEVDG